MAPKHETYRRVADKLALRIYPRAPGSPTVRLLGAIDARPVRLVCRDLGRNGRLYRASSPLFPRLDLGRVDPGMPWRSRLAAWVDGGLDGRPLLAPVIGANEDEPARAGALFGGELRELSRRRGVSVDDGGVHITRDDEPPEPEIVDDLLAVARGAKLVDEARCRVPLARALAPFENAWQALAGQLGVELLTCPLAIPGWIFERRATVHAVRLGRGRHALEASVLFDAPLSIGLKVEPARPLDDLLERSNARTGDAIFDDMFSAHAASPDAAAELLDVGRRRALMAARKHGEVTMNDGAVTLRAGSVAAPAAIVPLVAHLAAVAGSLSSAAPGRGYR